MRSNDMTSAADPLRATFEPKEPRCRVCRDEAIRVLVNQMLDWRGDPIFLGPGKVHVVTYADILRDLEPLNARLGKDRRITYHSLRAHAERHYDLARYCDIQIEKELAKLHGLTVEEYRNFTIKSQLSTKNSRSGPPWLDPNLASG